MPPPSAGNPVLCFQCCAHTHPYSEPANYSPQFDPITRQTYLGASIALQCPFPTHIHPSLHSDYIHPNNFALLRHVSPFATRRILQKCVSLPIHNQPEASFLNHPSSIAELSCHSYKTLLSSLSLLPKITSTSPNNCTYLITSFFSDLFQSPLTSSENDRSSWASS